MSNPETIVPSHARPLEVAVVGLGYVGAVSAACLASMGHTVYGVDRDQHKVNAINEANAPFYEPGLEDLIRGAVAAGKLKAYTSMQDALAREDVALVCVGTPSGKDGGQNLDQLVRVCAEIRNSMGDRQKRLVLAIRSTVFPGTCENVVQPVLGAHPSIGVVSHPEFLREGSAVKDFVD